MKSKQLLLVACLAVINSAFAQKDAKTDPRFEKFMDKVAASKGVSEVPKQERPTANHFYKSYQDFVNNNPAPGILLSKGRTEVMGKASYGVDRNGTIEKLSVKELSTQYWGFCDQYGVLYRLTEKDAYLVIISGKITQYVRAGQCTGTLNKDSTFTLLFGMNGQGGYLDYASKGVNGEIVELDANLKNGKSKALEQMMSDHPEVYQRLLADEDQEKYIKDKYRKRENLTFKLQHYIREYNTL
ncbi:MAG: hypothetical protein RL491_341 [Bacteroidota bacterium]